MAGRRSHSGRTRAIIVGSYKHGRGARTLEDRHIAVKPTGHHHLTRGVLAAGCVGGAAVAIRLNDDRNGFATTKATRNVSFGLVGSRLPAYDAVAPDSRK